MLLHLKLLEISNFEQKNVLIFLNIFCAYNFDFQRINGLMQFDFI